LEDCKLAKKRVRLGRPPRHQEEILSKNRTFRVTPSLEAKLLDAVKETGRSVSGEIEFRLQESFRVEDLRRMPTQKIIADTVNSMSSSIAAQITEKILPLLPSEKRQK
jgi:hypothetical protein